MQPTISYNMMARLTRLKAGPDLAAAVEAVQRERHGFGFADALESIDAVRVPMLFTQVKNDVYTMDAGTGVNDVEVIYERCATHKQLVWIGPDQAKPFGSGKRFDAYNYFNAHPEELLAFLDAHMP